MLLNPDQWWGSGNKRTAFMAFMMMIFFFFHFSFFAFAPKNLYIVGRGITLGSLTNKLCAKEEKKNEKRTKKHSNVSNDQLKKIQKKLDSKPTAHN